MRPCRPSPGCKEVRLMFQMLREGVLKMMKLYCKYAIIEPSL